MLDCLKSGDLIVPTAVSADAIYLSLLRWAANTAFQKVEPPFAVIQTLTVLEWTSNRLGGRLHCSSLDFNL